MPSFTSPAFTCVGVPESARLSRCTSAAANAADGASKAAMASSAGTADRGRNNGTSMQWRGGAPAGGGRGGGGGAGGGRGGRGAQGGSRRGWGSGTEQRPLHPVAAWRPGGVDPVEAGQH